MAAAGITARAHVDDLKKRLARSGKDYEVLGPLGAARVRVRFLGTFVGTEVVWDATVVALQQCHRDRPPASLSQRAGQLRQFIEIGDQTPVGVRLTVGLAVRTIDEPTVRKTIVMIRNYKRLRRGRHEFGETCHLINS
jgi:hypothetical protein